MDNDTQKLLKWKQAAFRGALYNKKFDGGLQQLLQDAVPATVLLAENIRNWRYGKVQYTMVKYS